MLTAVEVRLKTSASRQQGRSGVLRGSLIRTLLCAKRQRSRRLQASDALNHPLDKAWIACHTTNAEGDSEGVRVRTARDQGSKRNPTTHQAFHWPQPNSFSNHSTGPAPH